MFGTRAHSENTTKVAGALDGQPPAQSVSYPRRGDAVEGTRTVAPENPLRLLVGLAQTDPPNEDLMRAAER